MSILAGRTAEERMVFTLLVVSAALTTIAVAIERLYALGASVSPEAVTIFAAGSLTVMTAALVRACWLRGRREPRALRLSLDRIAWGSMVYYPGAALSLVAHQWLGAEPASAIRVFSQLLALPLIVFGLVGLLWPPRFSKAQARVLIADALVGGLGLAVLWLLLIYPVAIDSAADAGTSRVWAVSEATMLLIGSTLILVLVSASRRRSALPGRQVWLVHAALLAAVLAGIADVMLEPRGLAGISVFLIGDLIGIALLCIFCLQPSMQPETEWESRAREIYASVGPLVPIPLACVALVGAMANYPSDGPTHATTLGGLLLIFLLIGVVVLRALASAELRGAARESSDWRLSNSTEEEWFQVLVGRTADLTLVLHRDGGIAYATPSVYRATGLGPQELRGRGFATLLSPDPVNQSSVAELIADANARAGEPTEPVDLLLRSSTGGREVEWQVTALVGLDMEGYLVHGRDVTDERRMAALLAESVSLDALTGLHNRHGFLIAAADRRGKRCVLAINLRRFADFNDQHGHSAGDQVLRHLAQVLRDLPTPVQEPARLSADTFALLVVGSVPDIEVVSAAASIRQAMRLIGLPDGRPLTLDVAAGYAVSESDDMPIDELLSRAELAMSRSRSLERSPLVRFDPNLRLIRDAAAAAEADLRTALRERSLVVRYQPIVRLSDGAVVAAEALVRRRRADGSLESPEVFIPLAEQLGFVDEVDQAVLMRSLGEMQEIAALTGRRLPVSVNISASELDDGLEHRILEALGQTGWSAEDLIIEVTETALATRTDEASRLLRRLQQAGCRVAMDDFGTGYSSMASLVEMPVDIVKIDASFTHRLTAAGRGLSVMRAIVEIGRSLNLVTVAEGLATMEQADLLRGMGCDRGQGFLYAPPLSAADLADYLRPDKSMIVVD